MTLTSVSIINGLSFGAEYIPAYPMDDIAKSIVLDFAIFRFIFTLS